MATSFNTTVKLYSGVPLVKGGTEVLYLSQGAAEGILAGFLTATYTAYYFERENRRYIQIDDTFGALDSVNYISFANLSHGGKIYFGFVDQVVYVNDHNTQIEFTIDPFPTFLGDTTPRTDSFIVRNTVKMDVRGDNLQDDYVPDSVKKVFDVIDYYEVYVDDAKVYFACQGVSSSVIADTGLRVGKLIDASLDAIHEHGGVIIGAYAFPSAWTSAVYPLTRNVGVLSGNPFAYASGITHEKIRTGVYNKVILQTPSGSKMYNVEQFANNQSIEFQIVGLMFPCPSLFIYPKYYNGVVDNLSEGVFVKFPAIPISSNAVYTNAEKFTDLMAIITQTPQKFISGAVSGFAAGGPAGGILGAAVGGITPYANALTHQAMKQFDPPYLNTASDPCLALNDRYVIQLMVCHPSMTDLFKVDKYMDYYGYNINSPLAAGVNINDDDKAFLQTGNEYFYGSEADDELNARVMSGIKIRKTLT